MKVVCSKCGIDMKHRNDDIFDYVWTYDCPKCSNRVMVIFEGATWAGDLPELNQK